MNRAGVGVGNERGRVKKEGVGDGGSDRRPRWREDKGNARDCSLR